MATRRPRRVFHGRNHNVAPVFGLWCALVCEAGGNGWTCEWEGRGKSCEECDGVKGWDIYMK